MSEIRIGMQLQKEIALPPEEQIRLLKKTGFDAFFAYWQYDTDVARLKKCADRHGMLFQSLHAPPEFMRGIFGTKARRRKGA